jgi:hypothetical protein
MGAQISPSQYTRTVESGFPPDLESGGLNMKIRAKSNYFFLGAVLFLLMVDCSLNNSQGEQTVQGEIKNIRVTEKDNGSQFELN